MCPSLLQCNAAIDKRDNDSDDWWTLIFLGCDSSVREDIDRDMGGSGVGLTYGSSPAQRECRSRVGQDVSRG
jgi:hypothetical protein